MLVALGDISSVQSKATEETNKEIDWLLDYATTHPDASITYTASNMILRIHSDASYLSVPRARSRVGGHFYLSLGTTTQDINDLIHSVSKILKNIVSSAAEVEIAATFENCKEALLIRTTLEELGHPQPPTPVQVDNTTAHGFANETIKIKRTKAIDMRYHWTRSVLGCPETSRSWGRLWRVDDIDRLLPYPTLRSLGLVAELCLGIRLLPGCGGRPR